MCFLDPAFILFQKPERYCIYCKKKIKNGKLNRHIRQAHKTVKEVTDILKQPLHIQKLFFQKKRKEGIFLYNMNLIENNKEPEMREKTSIRKDKLLVCTGCKGFYSHTNFHKHTGICTSNVRLPQAMKPVLLKKSGQ